MVVTRKSDGSPCRTVDLSTSIVREAFASESPFHTVRRIPRGSWKTVTDAWNGYHGMVLQESDRHLTTFITPHGRWRYVSSGEQNLPERKDVLTICHYDNDLEEHWWQTIELLTILGKAGIIVNADKFQFASKVIEFAGFRISEDSIEPLPKYLDVIRNFPTPKNISDVRSWFGLVNQVANYAQLRHFMLPFKDFLSLKHHLPLVAVKMIGRWHWWDQDSYMELQSGIVGEALAVAWGLEYAEVASLSLLSPAGAAIAIDTIDSCSNFLGGHIFCYQY